TDAKQLIDRALKAAGGVEKLQQPRGYTFKVTTTIKSSAAPDVTSTEMHYFQPPHIIRVERESQMGGRPQKNVSVVNGDKGWSVRDGIIRNMTSDSIKRGDFDITNFNYKHLLFLTNPGYSAT